MSYSLERGFSIVELMIALGVAGLLTAIGVPALRNFTVQQRIVTASQELQLDMAYARSEAITRADNVSVCTSTDGASCTSSGWAGARIVFVDSNQNGTVDGTDVMLQQSDAPASGVTVTPAPAGEFVSFNSRGQVNQPTVFSACYTGLKGRDLTVRSTGNPSISTPVAVCP